VNKCAVLCISATVSLPMIGYEKSRSTHRFASHGPLPKNLYPSLFSTYQTNFFRMIGIGLGDANPCVDLDFSYPIIRTHTIKIAANFSKSSLITWNFEKISDDWYRSKGCESMRRSRIFIPNHPDIHRYGATITIVLEQFQKISPSHQKSLGNLGVFDLAFYRAGVKE
jgi:hypothetical protein